MRIGVSIKINKGGFIGLNIFVKKKVAINKSSNFVELFKQSN